MIKSPQNYSIAFIKNIIEIGKTADELGLAYNTVSSAVNRFIENGILKKTSDNNRNRAYVYEEYLNILKKGT